MGEEAVPDPEVGGADPGEEKSAKALIEVAPDHHEGEDRTHTPPMWLQLGRGGELAALGLLLLLVVLLVLLCCWPSSTHLQDTPVCGTPACLRAAAQMVQRMNQSADPCSDFWSYSCGGWSISKLRTDQLDNSYEARLQRLVSREPQTGSPRSVAWKIKHLYESCMALDAVEADGDRPLRSLVNQLGGWHVLRDFSVLTWNYREQLVILHARHGASPFFRIAVVADPREPSSNIVQISPAGLGLPDRTYYYKPHDNHTEVSYKRYLGDAVQQLGGTSADARSFSEEVFHFEKRLAEVTPLPEALLEPLQTYHKMSLAELADKAPSIPLHDIISAKYPNARIDDSTQVLATSVKYLTQISNILTSSDREVVNNYMMWSFVSKLLPYLSTPYRTIVQMFREELSGMKQLQPRWQMCTHTLRRYMGFALAILHDSSVSAEEKSEAKEAVNRMFESLSSAVKKAIQDSSFTPGLRQNALNKVNAMALQVGYPTHIHTDSYLEEFYADLFVQKNNFFQNIQYGTSFLQAVEQRWLMKPTEDSRWMSAMADEDTVSYIAVSNEVVVPQRLLVAPHFHPGYPVAVLYGSIGAQMAEAVASSVLPWEVLHRSDGSLVTGDSMLANTTTRMVNTAEQCMAAIQTKDQPSLLLDRRAALRLLVKTSGLQAACHGSAAAVLKQEHIHQPALEHLEDNALFFIAYAQSLCSESEPWTQYPVNMMNFQFPGHKMLELLLRESQVFTETFKCNTKTDYFVSHKCKRIL